MDSCKTSQDLDASLDAILLFELRSIAMEVAGCRVQKPSLR